MDQEIIKITGKEKPNFLFIAHTQSTEEAQDKYFVTMKNVYEGKYGCECKHLKSTDLLDFNKVSEIISWADIIYEGGGNTLDMIALWKETGFDKVLRMAWENGKVMCGVSAGANCCALEIIDDEYRLITSSPIAYNIKPHGLKTYWEDGEYITEQIDDSLKFKPLSELLSRNSKNKTL